MAKESRKECRGNLSTSKLQSPQTTKWLFDNYEISDGVSLPRSLLYNHYLDFCQKKKLKPINAASFGKIIRHTFPALKTRRLGTRGQSKYHYYGISVKASSPYHDTVLSSTRQNASGFTQAFTKADTADEKVQAPFRAHVGQPVPTNAQSNGTLLPEFPTAESCNLSSEISLDKAKTFLIMYRAHCQRILDTILRANFSEVQNYLVHFWQGMPKHILVILGSHQIIDLICCCDSILYKAIGAVLIPGTLQPLPSSLTQAISQFAKQLGHWLEVSLFYLPESLQDRKLEVAKAFSQLLCRQTSISHLAQAARSVLNNQDSVSQMSVDLKEIDLRAIIGQSMWISTATGKEANLLCQFFDEFSQLLEQAASIDQYADWIEELVNICVVKPSEKEEGIFQRCAQQFLLQWSFLTSKIIMELTLKSSKSFGSFHLLQMLFDDYILYLIESRVTMFEGADDGNQKRDSQESSLSSVSATTVPQPTEPVERPSWYYDVSPTANEPIRARETQYVHEPMPLASPFTPPIYDYRFPATGNGLVRGAGPGYDIAPPHDSSSIRIDRTKLPYTPSPAYQDGSMFSHCNSADTIYNRRHDGDGSHVTSQSYHTYGEHYDQLNGRNGIVARRLFNQSINELHSQ